MGSGDAQSKPGEYEENLNQHQHSRDQLAENNTRVYIIFTMICEEETRTAIRHSKMVLIYTECQSNTHWHIYIYILINDTLQVYSV